MTILQELSCAINRHCRMLVDFTCYDKELEILINNVPQPSIIGKFNKTQWECAYCPATGEDIKYIKQEP